MPDADRSIAVTLNSSYLGFFAHAGFLTALGELGIRPGHFAGASSGGFTAGLAAAGKSTAEIREFVMQAKLTRQFIEARILARAPLVLMNVPGFGGVVDGDKLAEHVRRHLDTELIEDCPHPLHLAVTNLSERKSELISRGSLSEFMVATCALPGVFRPRAIDGFAYWDGGIANELPMEPWIDDPEVKTIIAHVIVSDREPPKAHRFSIARAFEHAHLTICGAFNAARIARIRAAGKELIIVETRTPRPRLIDPGRRSRDRCYELAMDSTRRHPGLTRAFPREDPPETA